MHSNCLIKLTLLSFEWNCLFLSLIGSVSSRTVDPVESCWAGGVFIGRASQSCGGAPWPKKSLSLGILFLCLFSRCACSLHIRAQHSTCYNNGFTVSPGGEEATPHYALLLMKSIREMLHSSLLLLRGLWILLYLWWKNYANTPIIVQEIQTNTSLLRDKQAFCIFCTPVSLGSTSCFHKISFFPFHSMSTLSPNLPHL